MRSAERRHSGRVGLVRRDGKKVDVAGMRTKFTKGGRSSQVEAFDKAWSFVIDDFQIGIDDPLDPIMLMHHLPR